MSYNSILLIAALFLTGCFKSNSCPKKEFREYIYNQSVKVTSGFYKGQTGKIISGAWVFESDCATPGFSIRLDLNGEEVKVSQFDLYAEEKK
jgi:PBP1b-binding outer membrane lipoprotein LpoB